MKAWTLGIICLMTVMCHHALGKGCDFGHFYVGDQKKVKDWAGSYEKAVKNSDAWRKDERIQVSRNYSCPMTTGDLYMVGEVTADEDYFQGLNLGGSGQIRLNGKLLKPTTGTYYNLDL
jgi:hypothetical protein